MFTHRGFNIAEDTDDLKKTVDDFMDSIVPMTTPDEGIGRIDAERIAMAHSAACIMLMPIEIKKSNHPMRRATQCTRGAAVFAPNRIQRKHLTTDSRLRNLMHGGILGALARRLTLDPTQPRQWHQHANASCIVRRANNAAGCTHVKWSIPEFQCRFNMGIRFYKPNQSQFSGLNDDDALALFNRMNTDEHRQAFLDECSAIANAPHQSRVVLAMDAAANDAAVAAYTVRRPIVVEDMWIAGFISGFTKVCLTKMAEVNNVDERTMERCTNLVNLYRFIARVEWMFKDPTVRTVLNLNAFYAAYVKRLLYMTGQGVEHSAYMLGRICPEMMTPEVHVQVVPNPRFYMVPQMLIQPDDDVFGEMKVACQAFMPPPPPPPAPAEHRRRCYSDSDSYSDGTDDTSDVYDYVNNDDNDDDNVNG
jgi:hypothetical protein